MQVSCTFVLAIAHWRLELISPNSWISLYAVGWWTESRLALAVRPAYAAFLKTRSKGTDPRKGTVSPVRCWRWVCAFFAFKSIVDCSDAAQQRLIIAFGMIAFTWRPHWPVYESKTAHSACCICCRCTCKTTKLLSPQPTRLSPDG